ncbi:MAG: ATP phosphoribosyltransferase regulatory subunit [Polyangiaceae bacterium]
MPRPLEHPLPAGMIDLLPEDAATRRALSQRILDRAALFGYALVTPPAFEFADVLERGLGALDPADVLRFVEPESGEVAALRPDMTPQIARMVATRLRGRPAPLRLVCEGTIVRRRGGRARTHRQIPQVGIELVGIAGLAGDLELLELTADVLAAVGLGEFTLDVGEAGVVRALLEGLAPEHQSRLSAALSKKDEAAIAEACDVARCAHSEALLALPRLHGGRGVLVEGLELLAGTPAHGAASRLLHLFDAVTARGLPGARVVGDLGEVRGFAYYTGAMFHVYAEGPGDPIASGGRYDQLLGRFGYPIEAAGLALDLDRLTEALTAACVPRAVLVRVVAVGPGCAERVLKLRSCGVVAVAMEDGREGLNWARAWGFTHVVDAVGWLETNTGDRIASPIEETRGSR